MITKFKLFEEISRDEILISHTKPEDIEECIDMAAKEFAKYESYEEVSEHLRASVNFDMSFVAKDLSGKIIGTLLLGESNLSNILRGESWVSLKQVDIENKKGLEGVGLVVLEEYRKSFVVYKLLQSVNDVKGDYDYLMVQQYEGLEENIKYGGRLEHIGYYGDKDNKINVYYKEL